MKLYTLLTALIAAFGQLSAAESAAQTVSESTSGLTWASNFDAAKRQAKAENKPIFMYFTGSDWCPWCMKMDSQILSTSEFQQALGSKMVFVKVDFPRSTPQDHTTKEQNSKLSKEFGVKGFPTVIILDSDGQKIEQMGYQQGGGAAYAKKVQAALDGYKK